MNELEPTPKAQAVDSLAAPVMALVRNRRVRNFALYVLPWCFTVVTGIAGNMMGEVRARLAMKEELKAAIAVRADIAAQNVMLKQQHDEEMTAIAELDRKLLDESQKTPGRVVALEKGAWFTWRALAELRAAAYAGQTAKRTELMDRLGQKFATMWQKAALKGEPGVAYDYVFARAHVE